MTDFKITKLKLTPGKAVVESESTMHVDLEFCMPEDHRQLLDPMFEYYEVLTIDDPAALEKDFEDSVARHNGNVIAAINDDNDRSIRRAHMRKAFVSGTDKLSVSDKPGHYIYREYITLTPVTRALIAELQIMYKEPSHSYHTTPPFYFVKILECLDKHWD